tara:strand:+ start:113 stop:613 length:501 start_codon:yes stop_codon:yes gene_type:complete
MPKVLQSFAIYGVCIIVYLTLCTSMLPTCCAHATLSTIHARQLITRWKPDMHTDPESRYEHYVSVRRYNKAVLAMDCADHAFVGTHHGQTLYVINLLSSSEHPVQHSVSSILWDKRSRDAKIECIRSLKRWHTMLFPTWRLTRTTETLEDEDKFAWRMALDAQTFL